ncbi:MAG: L-histidine N(alpha)-methyltransferase [Candidatus Peribacteria bacterium]|jgi:uncharacterized SAM-dependent methyltransferase|nr:L-histidine N(alpha)-methyltransferase [Candidatus Peribacteria bacterium]
MGKNKEDIYINSNLIPPSPERDTILQNIFLSFGQPDASFLYQGAASTKLYEQLIHDPQYFPYQSSLDVIRNNRSTLQKFLGKKLLDYGSGTGEKAALLLQNSGRKLQYVPLDYSTEMMNEATTRLGKYPHINAKQGILINGESEDSLVTDIDDKTVLFS